jgi:hypothetical protein
MKTTHSADAAETAAALADMQRRHDAAGAVRRALETHFPPGRLAEVIAGMPEELQAKYREQLVERPVIRRIKITRRPE